MNSEESITNVNEYDLEASPDAFLDAIAALAKRTEETGHAGVLSYQFFGDK